MQPFTGFEFDEITNVEHGVAPRVSDFSLKVLKSFHR